MLILILNPTRLDAAVPVAAAHHTATAPEIDGRLAEPVWLQAARLPLTTTIEPTFGAPPTQRTEFALLWSDTTLYVGVWAHDTEAHLLREVLARRDSEEVGDQVRIFVDSYGDKRTAFGFGVSVAGGQRDEYWFDDGQADTSWDAVWQGRAHRHVAGWTAEFAIPLAQLRFVTGRAAAWGLQVQRFVARTGETMAWAPYQPADPQFVSTFGRLEGLANAPTPRRLELLPYARLGTSTAQGMTWGLGADAKLGLSSAFTLVGTVYPDFGQVEGDPAVINLSANELRRDERRPFFLEGTDLFSTRLGTDGNESLVYTRRFGGAPHGASASLAAPIYAAAKLSGQTSGGLSLGALSVLTGPVAGDASIPDAPTEVEPLTHYMVLRARQALRQGASTVGAMLTGVQRAPETAEALGLQRQAYAALIDGSHRFARAYEVRGAVAGSWLIGGPNAMTQTQTAAHHLFQRPGQARYAVQPEREMLFGLNLDAQVGKVQAPAAGWRYGLGGNVRTPGFDVNDAGYATSTDHAIAYVFASYSDARPGSEAQSWEANGNAWVVTDLAPRTQVVGGSLRLAMVTPDFWEASAGVRFSDERWSNTYLRGGPALRGNWSMAGWFELATDSRKRWVASLGANASTTPATASYSLNGWGGVRANVRTNVELALEASTQVREHGAQYVDEVQDAAATTRYLGARLRQVEASATLRANWTFSPRLSWQWYVQPLVAAGNYRNYVAYDQPEARRFEAQVTRLGAPTVSAEGLRFANHPTAPLTVAQPDYATEQLQLTSVVRWDYRPGAALLGIWSHQRAHEAAPTGFALGRGLQGLVVGQGEHVIMLKATYWYAL